MYRVDDHKVLLEILLAFSDGKQYLEEVCEKFSKTSNTVRNAKLFYQEADDARHKIFGCMNVFQIGRRLLRSENQRRNGMTALEAREKLMDPIEEATTSAGTGTDSEAAGPSYSTGDTRRRGPYDHSWRTGW